MSGRARGGNRILGTLRTEDGRGVVRMEACAPPQRLLVLTWEESEGGHAVEATLTADGGQTILVIEERGMPPEDLAAYGAGIQIHVEDLASCLAGG
ncbi:MAG TPA: hypothetical protein VGD91_19325, partial [Trebonia sp.]